MLERTCYGKIDRKLKNEIFIIFIYNKNMSYIGEIALNFMFIRDQVKIYHWTTTSFARHKSSDALVASLSDKMDKFLEIIQGIHRKRLIIPKNNKITLLNIICNGMAILKFRA